MNKLWHCLRVAEDWCRFRVNILIPICKYKQSWLFTNFDFIKSKKNYILTTEDLKVGSHNTDYCDLTGYLKKNLLEKMTEFSFSIGIKMIDCLNQRKKQILYFLQLTKVLKTKRATTVVFNVVYGSVWQTGRKTCLLSCLIGVLPWQKGSNFLAQKAPQMHMITEYQDAQQRGTPINSKSLPMQHWSHPQNRKGKCQQKNFLFPFFAKLSPSTQVSFKLSFCSLSI